MASKYYLATFLAWRLRSAPKCQSLPDYYSWKVNVIQEIVSLILALLISHSTAPPDKWTWNRHLTGWFTVKSAYHFTLGSRLANDSGHLISSKSWFGRNCGSWKYYLGFFILCGGLVQVLYISQTLLLDVVLLWMTLAVFVRWVGIMPVVLWVGVWSRFGLAQVSLTPSEAWDW